MVNFSVGSGEDGWVDDEESKPQAETKVERKKVVKKEVKAQKKPVAKKVAKASPKKLHPIVKGGAKAASKPVARKKAAVKGDDAKVTLNFKVPPTVAQQIRAKADRLTKGNVTQMVKLALLDWKPSPERLEGLRKTTRV